ncbi:hypothetical protein DFS34DRAFT_7380 [Phlyctochytrium arcticum]|nr:hypothetical protein DFS34DRAFT_7380 [Phlyctochytrium arcticum]
MADQDDDFTSLPLTERLSHKSWKARQGAYEELAKLFNTLPPDADAEYKKWQEYTKKMMTDANAVAQEAGVGAVLAYVTNAPNGGKTRNVLSSMVVDKCFGSNRTGTKQKGLEILFMYIEIESPEPVIEDIISGINHKTPKNVVAAIFALRESLRLFGSRIIPVKPIVKQLSKIFDHKDKNVRLEGTALALELYRWLGSAIINSLNDLKPVQLKELKEQFENLPQERPTAERLIRSEQNNVPESGEVDGGEVDAKEMDGAAVEEPEPIDAFDLADPVNILDKLPKNFYTELASTKWKERKEVLDNLLEVARSPKLEDGRYGELIGNLGKRISDANLFVAISAANCIEAIARGLRSNFAQYRSLVLSPMIERLKEKKQNVVDALKGALDAVAGSVTIVELAEEMGAAIAHKNPQVRTETLHWVTRCLKTMRKPPGKNELKILSVAMVKAMEDSTDTVRDGAAEGLGTMMKVVTERVMLSYLDKLDNIKQAKIREYFEKAEVKASSGTKAAPPAAKKTGSARPATMAASKPKNSKIHANSMDDQDKENHAPVKARPATMKPAPKTTGPIKRPATGARPATGGNKSTAAAKATIPVNAPVAPKYTEHSAWEYMTETFGENLATELSDSAWKVRLGAAVSLLEKVEQLPNDQVEAEAVTIAIASKPGWKENNFQVMTNMIKIFKLLAQEKPSFNRAAGAAIIPGLADNLGDMKVKRVAGDCLTVIAEKLTFQFVLNESHDTMMKQKSPKVLADALLWIQQTLLEFGTAGLALRELIEFIKVALANTNAAVRGNAVTLLGTLRMFVGPDIRSFVQDLNPQLLTTIDAEFEKAAAKTPPKPSKQQGSNTIPAAGTAGAAITAVPIAVPDPVEDLFPRVDLNEQMSPQLVDDLGDAQWKVRKAALDELSKLIESTNKRVQPNLSSELMAALKGRLTDSNKNLAMNAVEITGQLAVAVGKPFERYVRTVIGPMTTLLGDQKAHVRGAAIAALENVYTATDLGPLITSFATSLMTDQPQMRKDLLKWLGDKLEAADNKLPDLSPLVQPILVCLQDRSADVRKGAQTVLGYVAQDVGIDAVYSRCNDLFRGAAHASVTPYLETLRSTSSRHAPAASAAKPGTPSRIRKPLGGNKSIVAPSNSSDGNLGSKLKASAPATKLRRPLTSVIPATKREADPAKDSGVPIISADLRAKEQRAAADKGLVKWTFDSLRPELVEFLSEQSEGHFAPEIHTCLFSTDHYKEKEFLSALTALDEPISSGGDSAMALTAAAKFELDVDELKARYLATSDLILKYVTLRFLDTNTSMLLKCLDLLDHLFSLMDEEGYHLSEYEASCFLPFFVQKLGDPKETMRIKMRSILKRLTRIYPASKLFSYCLKGLESKNARTRTECLEELASLIQRSGMTVCSPGKAFPLIAAQLADRDATVRGGALGAITQAYLHIGDGIWKHLGRISEKDKSFVEERLRRVSNKKPVGKKEDPPSPRMLPGTTSPKSGRSSPNISGRASPGFGLRGPRKETLSRLPLVGDREIASADNLSVAPNPPDAVKPRFFSLDLEKHGLVVPEKSKEEDLPPRRPASVTAGTTPFIMNPSSIPSPKRNAYVAEPQNSYTIDLLIKNLNKEPSVGVEALKQLEDILGTQFEIVAPYMNDLIQALTLQNRVAYAGLIPGRSSFERLCKHLVNVLVIIFSQPLLARSVGREKLKNLLGEILNRILDPILEQVEAGVALSKALNILVVKILESVDRNHLLGVSLELLISSSEDLITSEPEQRVRHGKHMNLILRCIWRVTKTIPRLIQTKSIKPDILLYDIHKFFVTVPPREWKRRATEFPFPQADMPFRTVKTIIGEIVKALGPDLRDAVHLIPNPDFSYCVRYAMYTLEERTGPMGDIPDSRTNSEVDLLGFGTPGNLHRSSANSLSTSPVMSRARSINIGPNSGGSLTSLAMANVGSLPNLRDPDLTSSTATITPEHHSTRRLSDSEIETELARIFTRIGNREQTKQGLQDLYDFQKTHPYSEPRVESKLVERGGFFEGYIRRGLVYCKEDEEKSKQLDDRRSRRGKHEHSVSFENIPLMRYSLANRGCRWIQRW